MASQAFTSAGSITALASLSGVVVAAHADGSVSTASLLSGKLFSGGGSNLELPSAASLTGVACAAMDGAPYAVACDADGGLHLLSVDADAPAHIVSAATGVPQLSCVAWQHGSDFVAVGDARRGCVRVYAAGALQGAGPPAPLWAGAAAGGRGPGVSSLLWWPYSASNILAACGGRVVLMDARAPACAPDGIDVDAGGRWPTLTSGGPDVFGVALTPDDPWGCVGALGSGGVARWDLRRPGAPLARSSGGHTGPAWAVAVLPEGRGAAGGFAVGGAAGAPSSLLVVSAGEDGCMLAHRFGGGGDGDGDDADAAVFTLPSPVYVSDTGLAALVLALPQPGDPPGSAGTLVAGGDSAAFCVLPAAGVVGAVSAAAAAAVQSRQQLQQRNPHSHQLAGVGGGGAAAPMGVVSARTH